MILETGDMWSVFGKTDIFFITTNPIRKKDGAIVMGRGIALEAKTRFPELPYDFGKRLTEAEYIQDSIDPLTSLNIGYIGTYDKQKMGWFMTKAHWKESSVLSIIEESTEQLQRTSRLALGSRLMFRRIDLNFPGIGNGKLKREDVLPLLERLPNNVHIWEKE